MKPSDANETLRLILVEDSEDDALLVLRELRRGGFNVTAQRVDTAPGLSALLATDDWDLVISDHNLPQFSAPEALRLVHACAGDLPFIIVSGSMGEDLAVAALKAGAADYIIKGQLARLCPAVRRELADAEQRRQAEESLRRTEDQLRQSQKMEAVGRLAGGIAHDFNNLLTAILGYSELLLERMPANSAHRDDVGEILKAGDRAAALTRQLLAFSRQQVFEPRVVNFNHLVINVEKLLHRVTGTGVQLVTELDPAIGRVKVDVGQIEQVLMNLVINARDAMPSGGRISIRTSREIVAAPFHFQTVAMEPGQYLLVTVTDTGTGMTADVAKQIFEPFFTTKAEGRGTGLGLSTAYGIVKQSGGHISVDSEPGRGTVFEIYLPCVDEPLDDLALNAGSPPELESSGTVLLAEDDEGIRGLLRRTLEDAGYSVLTAADGVEAMAVAGAHAGAIDVLITDFVMPRLGGSELAAQLVADRENLAVLFVSAHSNHGEWNPEAATSRWGYLQKPFTPSVLKRRIRDLLDTSANESAA